MVFLLPGGWNRNGLPSKQVRFRIFNARHVNCSNCSLLLFCIREINRFLETDLHSRVSKNSSSVSKLETRNSSLETRFSIRENIEYRVLSRDCQLTFAWYCMPRSFELWINRINPVIVYNILGKTRPKFHASNESMKKRILIYKSIEAGLKYFLNLILISELFARISIIWLHSRLEIITIILIVMIITIIINK